MATTSAKLTPLPRKPIFGGKPADCLVEVRTWHEHGMEIRPGRGARRQRGAADLFVIHWTGGEGTAKRLYRVLRNRELGVEFAIEGHGHAYQYADPVFVDAYHAGLANKRAVGVEIVGYGFAWGKDRKVPTRGRDRHRYVDKVHGRKVTHAGFRPSQVASALALLDTSHKVLKIPRRIPREKDGSIMRRMMTRQEFDEFSGVIGHYHVPRKNKAKRDPGTQIFEILDALGYD